MQQFASTLTSGNIELWWKSPFLGIHVTLDLTWSTHITHLVTKAQQSLFLILRKCPLSEGSGVDLARVD